MYIFTLSRCGRDLRNSCQVEELDVITGFMVMDGAIRIAVLEGIAGGESMVALEQTARRSRPNDAEYKLLFDKDVSYDVRLYTAYDVTVGSWPPSQPPSSPQHPARFIECSIDGISHENVSIDGISHENVSTAHSIKQSIGRCG